MRLRPNRVAVLAALLLVAQASSAGTFVTGSTALPSDRTNAPGLGAATSTYQADATFLNYATHAADDLRTHTKGWVNVLSYGADSTGATNTTAAVQSAIDALSTTGGTVFFPQGVYAVTTLTLPVDAARAIALVGSTPAQVTAGTVPTTGSVIKCTAAATDCIKALSTIFSLPAYRIENLSVLGRDTWTPRTTTSGNGIRITGTANAPVVTMRNVFVTGFLGSGKAGVYIDNAEDSVLDSVFVSSCNYGFNFSGGAFNGNTLINVTASQNVYGMNVDGSGSVSVVGGVIQSNEKSGLTMTNALNWTFTSTHFENNNSTSTAGEHAIKIAAATNKSVQFISFIGCPFFTPNDNVDVQGVAGYVALGVHFLGGYMNPVSDPKITFGTYAQDCTAEDIVNASQFSDSGSTNRIFEPTTGRLVIPALDAAGVVGISSTATHSKNLGGQLTISDANTTGTVTFGTAETNTSYRVVLTPVTKTGAAAAGSNRIVSVAKSTGSFVATLEAAPGVGTSVAYDWFLFR